MEWGGGGVVPIAASGLLIWEGVARRVVTDFSEEVWSGGGGGGVVPIAASGLLIWEGVAKRVVTDFSEEVWSGGGGGGRTNSSIWAAHMGGRSQEGSDRLQ